MTHSNPLLERRFIAALGVSLFVFLAELAGGWWTASLALLSDSAHVFLDVFALALCYIALRAAARPADDRHTYGWHRLEVFAALANGVTALSSVGALALWGFGLWWLAAASLLLRKYLRTSGVPFGIGWWAFTLPLGAYTVATLTLARVLKVGALEGAGLLLFVLLAGFWLVVTGRTLGGIRTGEVWRR